jgi:hypothetical protein
MTAVALTPVTIDRTGSIAIPASTGGTAANAGVTFANSGNQVLFVWGTGTDTLTFAQPNTQDGVASPGKIVSITSTTASLLGPFPVAIYGTTVTATSSAATTKVTCAQFVPNA